MQEVSLAAGLFGSWGAVGFGVLGIIVVTFGISMIKIVPGLVEKKLSGLGKTHDLLESNSQLISKNASMINSIITHNEEYDRSISEIKNLLDENNKNREDRQKMLDKNLMNMYKSICKLIVLNDHLSLQERFEAFLDYISYSGNGNVYRAFIPVIVNNQKEWLAAVTNHEPFFNREQDREFYKQALEKIECMLR